MIEINLIEKILEACDRHTLSGLRDYAILQLLIENSLKRQQIVAIDVSDFDYERRSLRVQCQYRKHEQQNFDQVIDLSLDTANAIQDWLSLTYIPNAEEIATQTPLFISLDRASYGHRLSGTAIYGIVKRSALNAGIAKAIAPEQLRFNRKNISSNQDSETLNRTCNEIDETQIILQPKSPIISAFTETDPNILKDLLSDKRSLNTRRAYQKDLHYFFEAAYGQKPTESVIAQFLQLNRFEAIAIVLRYKSELIARNLKEATINRRLSALKSLVNFAAKLGKCNWNLDDIQSETVQSYRDTTGIKPEGIRTMLLSINRNTDKGKRDFAILRLLWDNALRRNEVVSTNIGDFDYEGRSLQILGKGRGSQKSLISLSVGTTNAIRKRPIDYKIIRVSRLGTGTLRTGGIREGRRVPNRAARQDSVRKSKIERPCNFNE